MADQLFPGPGKRSIPTLTLGTAQLGMAYGIANREGKPTEAAALAVLDAAWAAGMTCFDTAHAYGDAEMRIGAWRRTRAHTPLLISKFGDCGDAAELHRQLDQSRRRLGAARIDGYLAHRPDNLARNDIVDTLCRAAETGQVGAFGASVYTVAQARAALAVPNLRLLQIPINVFNQAFIRSDVIAEAATAGVFVWARSVFLQGLLLAQPDAITARLAALKEPVARLHALASDAGLSPWQLAIGVVRAVPGVASIVVGVDSKDQLPASTDTGTRLDSNLIATALTIGRDLPEGVVDPSHW